MAVAKLDEASGYVVTEPEPVPDPAGLLNHLQEHADGGSVLLGFDFPIGLPSTYCDLAGITNFLEILPEFGKDVWPSFYEVARDCSEISIRLPFCSRRQVTTTSLECALH